MLAQVRSWWRAPTQQSRLAGEMASEMDSHMDRYAADLIARDVEPGEARRLARIEFGSTAATAEECREAVGLRWSSEFAGDLRYKCRVKDGRFPNERFVNRSRRSPGMQGARQG